MQIKFSNISTEPVSLTEMKLWLKVDFSDDDDLITSLITAVREKIEVFIGKSLVSKTIEFFDEKINDEIALPFPPHDEIIELKINGELSTDYYKTGLDRFIINPNYFFSTEVNDRGLYVKYTVLGDCPEAIKLMIKKTVDENYRNRGNTFEGSVATLNENAFAMLIQYIEE